jgi:hypothetical protein
MTKQEVFAAIKKLVSPSTKLVKGKFERVALEGGEVFITNQTENEIALGDIIYIETESGFENAPEGTHTLEDGRVIVLDEFSVVIEIREDEEVEEVEVEEENEIIVEASEETEISEESARIEELKSAILNLLLAFESHSKDIDARFKSLEADYKAFKKEAEYNPIKKDNSFKKKFSKLDARIDVIKELKK